MAFLPLAEEQASCLLCRALLPVMRAHRATVERWEPPNQGRPRE